MKSELGGNFENVIIGLMMPTAEYCAKQCHKAIKGAGTNEDILVEILCSRPYDEIQQIAAAYQNREKNLEKKKFIIVELLKVNLLSSLRYFVGG